jgi:putative transposase
LERLFSTIQNSFLPEFYILLRKEALGLNELNEYLWIWFEKYYHNRVHSATKQPPRLRFEADAHALRNICLEELYDAFLMEEKRVVDKTMLLSVHSKLFQTVAELIKRKVTVRYDPYELDKVQVYFEGRRYPDAKRFVVAEHGFAANALKEALPQDEGPATGLNFLTALRDTHREGLSFSRMKEEKDES